VKDEDKSQRLGSAGEDLHDDQWMFRLPPSATLNPKISSNELANHTLEGVKGKQKRHCPVYVMMPLDTVHVSWSEHGPISDVQSPEALALALAKIKHANVKVGHSLRHLTR
jgi:hypothetical protein